MKVISVLIQRHAGPTGDVLICKKDGAWCFPCTTLRTNETGEEAAARVAAEQLHMVVKVGKLAMIGRKKPADGYVEHIVEGNITHNTHTKDDYHEYYEAVNTWGSEPCACCCEEYKWVHASQLGQYEFAGDDANFMAKYDPWINGRDIPNCRMY